MSKSYLCRDINGGVHIVNEADLIRRTSAYGVIEGNGGVLLVHDRTSDETWDLPGGGLDAGEEVLAGLNREVKEETGLDVVGEPQKICEFVEYFYDVDSGNGWESTRHFFKVATEGTPNDGGNDDDVLEIKYFTDVATSNVVAPVTKEIVRLLKSTA